MAPEAAAALVRTSFSTIVRESNDFACVLTDERGNMLAQNTASLPPFIGTLPATVKHFLKKFPAHTLKPGDYVLVWGASGGLGVFGVQLAAASGAKAIGVVSNNAKRDYVMDLGAYGVINRNDFKCWGQMPKVNTPEYNDWVKEARKFGKAIWDITGKRDVDIVFEHPGEQTFPVSCLVVKRGGMVVFCAGTSGFNLTFDARYVWMRQKRIQGSHFAHLKQAAAANQFVLDRRVDP